MKICVFGAGAVGGIVAARLVKGGADISVVARGEHLAAIQNGGLRVRDRDGEWSVQARATDDTKSLGPQDLLILGLKAHTVTAALDQITPLLSPETIVLHIVNGIPWWFFHGLGGKQSADHLESVDPGGHILKAFGREWALGCVVHIASNMPEPGLVEHNAGGTFFIGEPDNSDSPRLASVVQALSQSGLRIRPTTDIRSEVWGKLWANVTGNPVSVLLEARFSDIFSDPALRVVMAKIIEEGAAVAKAYGSKTQVDIEARLDGLAGLGSAKTSMLQDYEAGKSIEVDALVGAVSELGRLAEVATPTIDLVYALTRQKAKIAGLYAAPGS
ncbi:MAG: 2-dehydropantoate 2-reductase [Proteobacteria bacterium]|nr:2-dehydropantoate 2-reductase [Pseudomonadota bacterium]